jgi:GNAT superfamily N-acetyltransferase
MSTITLKFHKGDLTAEQSSLITEGFKLHAEHLAAPLYNKERLNWLAHDERQLLIGAVTADLLWDWIYIDELFVNESSRGQGIGKKLMLQAEQYAIDRRLTGVWLWTQSWQAADFYQKLGYEEFTRFNNFPQGHTRIGFRKTL